MIKKAIKQILKKSGYTLIKEIREAPTGMSIVKVGNFDVSINNNNGIKNCYLYYKDYGRQLLRITSFLARNYSDLEVIDVGANLGDSVALIKSGADVPVICIEGDKDILDRFKLNTSNFKNVKLIPTFLSDKKHEQDCEITNKGHNLTITPSSSRNGTEKLYFSSIDTLLEESVLNQRCKLLKIDTEGHDLKILRGSEKFLAEVKPTILFEFNRNNLDQLEKDPAQIFHWLLEKNYRKILFYESDGRFMFSSDLSDAQFIKQIFNYVDGKNSKIYYLDLIVFHADFSDKANEFIKNEEIYRSSLDNN
ncbi:FkbM family methyltransferase [Mucilaginibacter sp. McL0603]|uniref:FkbM family methyltransferase n=1 Tax=Mucilaginibacter sp. McL0603 TaxID=3415670 RepID=UPI003CF0CAED